MIISSLLLALVERHRCVGLKGSRDLLEVEIEVETSGRVWFGG